MLISILIEAFFIFSKDHLQGLIQTSDPFNQAVC